MSAIGATAVGGIQSVSKSGYTINFLPDLNNDQLQREGKPSVYYWLPNEVRLAQKTNGDYKFSFAHFVGDDASAEGEKTGGGALAFSTTMVPPDNILNEMIQEISDRFRGKSDLFWGWRNNVAPSIVPAQIVSNTMQVSNFGASRDGRVPVVLPGRAGGAPLLTTTMKPETPVKLPRNYPASRASRAGIDRWAWNMQGEGPGSVSPTVENAFFAMMGSYPAAVLWDSFHGGSSLITLNQLLKIKVWSPVVTLSIQGNWSKVQEHFSAAFKAQGFFWSVDAQAEFNNLVASGGITVSTKVDGTLPNAAEIEKEMEKTKALVFQQFMEVAKKMIFDPAPFQEEGAQAGSGAFGIGYGAAFKVRRDTVNVEIGYNEKRQFAYLQDYPISGQMEGLYDVIQQDPEAEKRYFRTVYLGDWERDVSRTFAPVVNPEDPERQWVGQPVAYISAQVGYPLVDGTLAWDALMFQPGNMNEPQHWKRSRKNLSDVANPPANWQPDLTFIKRKIHFREPPSEFLYPYARVQVEQNEVDLDPGANGTLTNEGNLTVRVESAGTLELGPITLGTVLEDATQTVTVQVRALGKDVKGNDRNPVRFQWKFDDQQHDRFYMLYTGQLDFVPAFEYKTHVLIKGTLFKPGMEWEDKDWRQGSGGGVFTISLRAPDSPDVILKRSAATSLIPAGDTAQPAATPVAILETPPAASTNAPTTPPGSPYRARTGNGKPAVSTVKGYKLHPEESNGGGSRAAENGTPIDTKRSTVHREYDEIVPSYD